MSTAKLERTTFRTSRLLDFTSEKELVAQTGHRREAWPLVVLKELVDNALDACEDSGVEPEIQVMVDSESITVTDNGPGIPKETIQGILDFSVRVSSREAYVSPTRGAQGNALKTLVAMPFVLDAEHGRIDISAHGVRHEIAMAVDRIRQAPRLSHTEHPDRLVKIGTSMRVHWPCSASSILEAAKDRFLQVARDYTWLNPHLTLSVDCFGDRSRVAATVRGWKRWLPSDPTCAHWYEVQHLERLVAAYIAHDADRGRDRTVRELISEFAGLSGTAKQKAVIEATGLTRTSLSGLAKDGALDTTALERLLKAMKQQSRPVKPKALGLIGRDHIEERCREAGCAMDSFAYKKAMDENEGVPWVVETAFGWFGEESRAGRALISGVNWSPGIINQFRELGKFGRSLDSVLEEQRAGLHEPVVLVIHTACPRVEYTDRGKSAVVIDGEAESGPCEEVDGEG